MYFCEIYLQIWGFSGLVKNPNSVVKNPPANAGDVSLITGSGRSPGEGNGNSFWEIPWTEATVHQVQIFGHDLVTKQHLQTYALHKPCQSI